MRPYFFARGWFLANLSAALACAAWLCIGVIATPVYAQEGLDQSVLLDPVAGIGFEGFGRDRPEHYVRRDHRGARAREEWANGPGLLPMAMVDCSGRRPGTFRSVTEAVQHVMPNGEIRIIPAAWSETCLEQVVVDRPLHILSDPGQGPAVIQAPDNASCLIARIPLGDTLSVEGVKIIGHGGHQPCIMVEAGQVMFRNVTIVSRGTDWAFHVGEMTTLNAEDLHIETDGSGIFVHRADIALSNVEVDMEGRPGGTGLLLQRVNGHADRLKVLGGDVGIAASAGVNGLKLSSVDVSNTAVGTRISWDVDRGPVELHDVHIHNVTGGIEIEPGVHALIEGGDVRVAQRGVTITQATATLRGIRIEDTDTGIWLAGNGDGPVEISGSTIAGAHRSAVHFETPTRAILANNSLQCGRDACFSGRLDSAVWLVGNNCDIALRACNNHATPDAFWRGEERGRQRHGIGADVHVGPAGVRVGID